MNTRLTYSFSHEVWRDCQEIAAHQVPWLRRYVIHSFLRSTKSITYVPTVFFLAVHQLLSHGITSLLWRHWRGSRFPRAAFDLSDLTECTTNVLYHALIYFQLCHRTPDACCEMCTHVYVVACFTHRSKTCLKNANVYFEYRIVVLAREYLLSK